jgi:hypothetical protein
MCLAFVNEVLFPFLHCQFLDLRMWQVPGQQLRQMRLDVQRLDEANFTM